jgi:hypothetical protein
LGFNPEGSLTCHFSEVIIIVPHYLKIYVGQQPNFTVEMTLQGISGLRTFQIFSLKKKQFFSHEKM